MSDIKLVKGDNNCLYWQVTDKTSQHGFYLVDLDGETTWDGGFNSGIHTWEVISKDEWPEYANDRETYPEKIEIYYEWISD